LLTVLRFEPRRTNPSIADVLETEGDTVARVVDPHSRHASFTCHIAVLHIHFGFDGGTSGLAYISRDRDA